MHAKKLPIEVQPKASKLFLREKGPRAEIFNSAALARLLCLLKLFCLT